MNVFMRAVKRPPPNVYTTLCSMTLRDPSFTACEGGVTFISGDGNDRFLRFLKRTNGSRVWVADRSRYEKIDQWHPKRKACWSYLAFLKIAQGFQWGDALVTEDDVEFANGWYQALIDCIRYAELRWPDGNWILSGYYGFRDFDLTLEEPVVELPESVPFWGNLCTYWPMHVQPIGLRVIQKALDTGDPSESIGTDHSLEIGLRENGIRILVCVPSLVDHLGQVSTLRDDGIRKSPIYSDRYEE